MKRSGPPQRRIGLVPGPGPERKTPLRPGRPPEPGTPLRRYALQTIRRYAATPRPRYNRPGDETRSALIARSGGRCEIGVVCGGDAAGVDMAHRLGKGMGGTSLPGAHAITRLLLACRACHERIDNIAPAEAEAHGWKVRHGITDPADVPVTMLLRGTAVTVYLTPDGLYSPVPAGPEVPGA